MPWKHVRLDATTDAWLTLWIDVADRALNVLNREVFGELREVIDHLRQLPTPTPVVVRSAKARGFVVGADLREILGVREDSEIRAILGLGQEVLSDWESMPHPTVAWVRGACLGGGLELALACQYIAVCDTKETQLGMPETNLGLTPGWGGTQRLPPLVGMHQALEMLLYGESIGGSRALEMGLADGVWSPENEEASLGHWMSELPKGSSRRTDRRIAKERLWLDWKECEMQRAEALLLDDPQQRFKLAAREAILMAVEAGVRESQEEGLRMERVNFFRLLNRPEVQSVLQRFAPRKPSET